MQVNPLPLKIQMVFENAVRSVVLKQFVNRRPGLWITFVVFVCGVLAVVVEVSDSGS